jgi:hypothetical protein
MKRDQRDHDCRRDLDDDAPLHKRFPRPSVIRAEIH